MLPQNTTRKAERTLALLVVLCVTGGFLNSWSSSKPEVWEGWEAHNPNNAKPVDHAQWGKLLKKYVRTDKTGLNRFAYGKVSSADRVILKNYIKQLSAIEVTGRARPVQFAYWINLYNALTIDVVLDHYPVKSIRDIDISGVFANGPWGKPLVKVEGEEISLDDIEHQILRPIWKDPRIHYGVNCASIGCPNLLNEPFTAASIDSQLDQAARDYINHPRGLSVKNGKATVSKIYQWFAYDFGNSQEGVVKHLLKYAASDRAAALRKAGGIAETAYDWSLNE